MLSCAVQSYGGGRNLWGEHEAGQTGPKALGKEPFQEPSHSDGRLEVRGPDRHEGHAGASHGTRDQC